MRQRIARRLPNRCEIYRETKAGENELGEPLYDGGDSETDQPVESGVPCAFDDESTSFVREDSGERVQRPAAVRFEAHRDIREGDTLDVDAAADYLEVRGIDTRRDHVRGQAVMQVAEVERV
jgi:hypothetical protein